MLDFADAPAFLVQHLVVDHAADGELGVLFDRIVLEVFVAAVAVDQVAPVRDSARGCRGRARAPSWRTRRRAACSLRSCGWSRQRRAWPGRLRWVRGRVRDRALEEGARLLDVRAVAEVEGEGFEPRGVHAELAHDVVGGEEDAAAVDASGERDADRVRSQGCVGATARISSASAPM